MTRTLSWLAAVATLAAVARSASACPACTNPNLQVGETGGFRDRLDLGTLHVRLDTVFTHATSAHSVHPADYEPGLNGDEQPIDHEVESWMTGFQVSASYGLGHRIGVDIALPVRITVLDATFHGADGAELDIESIHHRDETIAGIGDLELGVRFGVLRPSELPRLSIDLRLGVSFPTGHVEDDPYALAAKGQSHIHSFFGQGTFVPQFGLDLSFATPAGSVGFSVDGQWSLYAGDKGYEPPSFGTVAFGFSSAFDTPVTFAFRHLIFAETESYWDGVVAENSGRSDLSVELALGYAVGAGVELGLLGRATYFTVTSGGAFENPFLGAFSVSWTGETL